MIYRNKFTGDEWRTLEMAPIWIFMLVAAADKKLDKKEMKAFAEQIAAAPNHSDDFGLELFRHIHADLADLLKEASCEHPLQGLQKVRHLLERVDQKQAEDYRATLLLIGARVAQSSGALFQKNKVSKSEAIALVVAAAILKSEN